MPVDDSGVVRFTEPLGRLGRMGRFHGVSTPELYKVFGARLWQNVGFMLILRISKTLSAVPSCSLLIFPPSESLVLLQSIARSLSALSYAKMAHSNLNSNYISAAGQFLVTQVRLP